MQKKQFVCELVKFQSDNKKTSKKSAVCVMEIIAVEKAAAERVTKDCRMGGGLRCEETCPGKPGRGEQSAVGSSPKGRKEGTIQDPRRE